MKIVLHPGFHKSGTTSIQMFLRSAFGSEEPGRIWYPMRPIVNPGHSNLPFNLRRRNLRERGFQALKDYIERAVTNGTEVLILSAEDIGTLDRDILRKMREYMEGHALQVIFTMTPFKARVVSQWQEKVKHGKTISITDDDELLSERKLSPSLVSDIIGALSPNDSVAIVSSKSYPPDWLIRTFLEAADLQRHIEGAIGKDGRELNYSLTVNRSFGVIEIEIIRHLNMCFEYLRSNDVEFDGQYIQKRITNVLTSAAWKEKIPKLKIECPAKWESSIKDAASRAQQDIERLQKEGLLKVFGDWHSLAEGSAN